MDIESKISELEQKIDSNMDKIINNMNELHKHEKKINKNANKINENSCALDVLKTVKAEGKRMFIAMIVILFMWFATIGAFLYYINTTDYVEVEETAETDDGGNACVGDNCNNGEINYGKGD